MELHENLYALGQQLGRDVFDDPESFRGALDDFLDEDSATTGDINLLVDAVRLGAFASMTSMIDSGAQVTAAVEEAGHRLARDRGSADVAGAQWACAMLAFAIGKGSEADVRRYRTATASIQPAPPDLGRTRHLQEPLDVAVPGAPEEPRSPAGRRRSWPVIVSAAAVGAVVAAVAIVAVLATGDDDSDGGDGGAAGAQSESAAPSADLEAVQARYSGLGDDVTAGIDECEPADAGNRTTEVLECGFADGTLTLTTFASDDALAAHRSANIGLDAGSRFGSSDAGAVYSLDSTADFTEAEMSSLYWDSTEALQSGKYQASSGKVGAGRLVKYYDAVGGTVDYPTTPTDKGMIALAEAFLDVDKCDRIPTNTAGELEESYCPAPDGIDVWIVVFRDVEDFKSYRDVRVGLTSEGTQDYWSFGDVQQGTLADYDHDDGSAVRYWDRPECKCSMEAFLDSGDREVLTNWWLDPFGS